MTYLTRVMTTVIEPGAHHVVRDVDLHHVSQLSVHLVAQRVVDDGHLHVTHDARHVALCKHTMRVTCHVIKLTRQCTVPVEIIYLRRIILQ